MGTEGDILHEQVQVLRQCTRSDRLTCQASHDLATATRNQGFELPSNASSLTQLKSNACAPHPHAADTTPRKPLASALAVENSGMLPAKVAKPPNRPETRPHQPSSEACVMVT
jgi:hypothetical protein